MIGHSPTASKYGPFGQGRHKSLLQQQGEEEKDCGVGPTKADTVEGFTHSLICETFEERSSVSGNSRSRPSTCSAINSQCSEAESKEKVGGVTKVVALKQLELRTKGV